MNWLLLLFLALSTTIVNAQSFPQRENTHRLMSYNIRHGEGMDGKVDITRIGKVILNVNPEVVGLQEVDSITNRNGNIDIMQVLSEQTGMHATFGYSILHDGGKYGNGVLTRDKPIDTKKISLPGESEARTALIVELEKYVIVNTHLSLTNEERLESMKIITEAIKHYDKPVFLMGDLNAEPEEEPMKWLIDADWQILSNINQYTIPSEKPTKTIDYVLGYQGNGEIYSKFNAHVIENCIASDHCPLFVDVRVKTAADKVMRTIPYLQNPGTDEMTVMWLTNVPARSWVEYGTDINNMKRARTFVEGEMVANNKINRIHLSNLKPGTKYYYRAVSQEITKYSSYHKEFGDTIRTDIKSFTTWSDDKKDFRIIVYNDLHSNMGMFKKLHSQIDSKPYDLVIFNGDCFDDVEVESDIVERLLAYTPTIKSDEVPSIFIRGNHETRGEYSQLLWNYLGRMQDKSYSAFSLGDTKFVLLDCGEDKPDDHWVYYDMNDFTQHRLNQAEFLKREIKSKQFKKAKKRVLIHHIPLFGKDMDGQYTPCSHLWIPIINKAPFDVSINAHTHRFDVIEEKTEGNNFPVIIGGGNKEENGTVLILEKDNDNFNIKVVNTEGKVLTNKNI